MSNDNLEKFLLITIESTHLVMKVEKLLHDNEIKARIIPLPGELSATCGLSIRAPFEYSDKVIKILEENVEQNLYNLYLLEKNGYKKKISNFS